MDKANRLKKVNFQLISESCFSETEEYLSLKRDRCLPRCALHWRPWPWPSLPSVLNCILCTNLYFVHKHISCAHNCILCTNLRFVHKTVFCVQKCILCTQLYFVHTSLFCAYSCILCTQFDFVHTAVSFFNTTLSSALCTACYGK